MWKQVIWMGKSKKKTYYTLFEGKEQKEEMGFFFSFFLYGIQQRNERVKLKTCFF